MRRRRGSAAAVLAIALGASHSLSTIAPVAASPASGTTSTVAGGLGRGPAASLAQHPWAVAAAGSKVYVADTASHVVWMIDRANGDQETVIAGTGIAGFSGDAGPAVAAQVSQPSGVAADAAGNVYIADTGNHRVRRIDASGIMSTLAGTGTAGFSGDGGPAQQAQLSSPMGVAVDPSTPGNVFVADRGNNRVRKIDGSGTITTAAGDGNFGYSDGPATGSSLAAPTAVAVDAVGTLVIADTSNGLVRKVAGGVMTTIAGLGVASGDNIPAVTAHLHVPDGVAFDAATPANVFVLETGAWAVRRIDGATNIITTLTGTGNAGYSGDGGPAVSADINTAFGIAADPSGGLYIADTESNRVRRIDPGGIITTIAGNGRRCCYSTGAGPATWSQLNFPSELTATPGGEVYLADSNNHRVRRIDASGNIATIAGTGTQGTAGDGGPATAATLNTPYGLAFDRGGLFVADTNNNRVRRVDASGRISALVGTGAPGYSGDGGPAAAATLDMPFALAADGRGGLYVADTYNYRVRHVDASGTITTAAGTGVSGFSGDGGPAASAQLGPVFGLAVDRAGDLFVADFNNHRVRRVDASGTISTFAGAGNELTSPAGLAFDADDQLFIADFGAHVVRRVDPSGAITTVAGAGSPGLSGDGGPSTAAQLRSPTGVAVDSDGALFIADAGNNRVRRVTGVAASPSSVSARASTVSASGQPVRANGASASTVTVTLRTPGGTPVAGRTVTLTQAGGPGSPAISPSTSVSDALGRAVFAVSSTVVGVDTFGATDTSDAVSLLATAQVNFVSPRPRISDFDGDATTDVAVFRPSNGTWYVRPSSGGSDVAVQYGASGDVPVPADFDGDGKADDAVFRPSTGSWFARLSSGGPDLAVQYGTNGDIPVPTDFDGDGKADLAVFRPSNGSWFARLSGGGPDLAVQYGASGDVPVPADFDGDGKADLAVFRPSNGSWFARFSGGGPDLAVQYGASGDVAVPADYDGDGKTDLAVFRPSTGSWYVRPSSGGSDLAVQYGANGDVPVPGDFDGDGKADRAVYRPSTGAWYIRPSSGSTERAVSYGTPSDIPAFIIP